MRWAAWISDLLELPVVMTCVTSTVYVNICQNVPFFFCTVNEESEAIAH